MIASEAVQPTRLAFRDLIRRAFLILKDRPLFFFSLGAIVILPTNLMEWWDYEIAEMIIFSILDTAISGAIAYAVFKNLKEGNFTSAGQALPQALRWPLVGFALVCAMF